LIVKHVIFDVIPFKACNACDLRIMSHQRNKISTN